MKYRPDIDGLRALAIVPVVLYHTEFALFRGGFVGVDIFFVISGYLITFIIHEEIRQGRFSISRFYERRIRRIFPALFTVLLCCLGAAGFVMLPRGFEEFGQSVTAATLFVANIYFLTKSDYFGPAADTQPLLHTWSLSVEEQFYVFYPLVLVFIYRYFKGRWRPILVPASVVSLTLSVIGVNFFPSAAFYLLPTRGWELFLGAFLALGLFPKVKNRHTRDLASLSGLILILCSIFFFSRQTPFPGWHALFPCVGAALIIHAGQEGPSAAGRLLSQPVIVFIGLISYSLYLWHWPLMVFAKQICYDRPLQYGAFAVVALSCILAAFSWRFVERPFRKKGTAEQRKKLFAAAAGIMAVSIFAGVTIDQNQGLPARFGDKLSALDCDFEAYNLGTCFLREDQPYTDWQGEECLLQSDKNSTALLWGDSFAAHYIPGIKENLNLIDANIMQYTAGGCAPVFRYDPAYRPRCKKFSAQIDRILSEYKIDTVIMVAGWALALENGLTYHDLQDTVDILRGKGIQVILIGQSPRFDRSVQDISNHATLLGKSISESPISVDLGSINVKLKEIAGPDNFINPSKLFCIGRKCRFKGSEGFYFWDDGHFTSLGSNLAAEFIFSKIKL